MKNKPRNSGRPISQTVIAEVKRYAMQGKTAKQIALLIGRSEVAIFNIVRLHRIQLRGRIQ